VRPRIKISNPNPVNEGIMQRYARRVLEAHGIWDKISGGKECVSCYATPNNWFTAVHHRETPMHIKAGTSDAAIVWKIEVLAAVRDGARVEGVTLPPADSLRDEVSHSIGALSGSKRKDAVAKYLIFLASKDRHKAYAKFGFVPATAEELKLKAIP
jgi:ABC-type molybdate transport system substrate-binding protein